MKAMDLKVFTFRCGGKRPQSYKQAFTGSFWDDLQRIIQETAHPEYRLLFNKLKTFRIMKVEVSNTVIYVTQKYGKG